MYATLYSENVKPVSESNTARVFAAVAGRADTVLLLVLRLCMEHEF